MTLKFPVSWLAGWGPPVRMWHPAVELCFSAHPNHLKLGLGCPLTFKVFLLSGSSMGSSHQPASIHSSLPFWGLSMAAAPVC